MLTTLYTQFSVAFVFQDDSDEVRAKALSQKLSHNSIIDCADFEALKSCLLTIEVKMFFLFVTKKQRERQSYTPVYFALLL